MVTPVLALKLGRRVKETHATAALVDVAHLDGVWAHRQVLICFASLAPRVLRDGQLVRRGALVDKADRFAAAPSVEFTRLKEHLAAQVGPVARVLAVGFAVRVQASQVIARRRARAVHRAGTGGLRRLTLISVLVAAHWRVEVRLYFEATQLPRLDFQVGVQLSQLLLLTLDLFFTVQLLLL